MAHRYISDTFWSDTFVETLDPIEKMLFLYLLTNKQTNISGIFEISLKRMGFETGLDQDMVSKILARFEQAQRVYYIDGWAIVCNLPRHQSDSPKIRQGIEKLLGEVPEKIKKEILSREIPYAYPMHRVSNSALNKIEYNNLESDKIERNAVRENVYLSTSEYQQLVDKYGLDQAEAFINKLSSHKSTRHILCDNDYQLIVDWMVPDESAGNDSSRAVSTGSNLPDAEGNAGMEPAVNG